MADPSEQAAFQTGFLARPMGRLGIALFGIYFILLSVLATDLLIGAWPGNQHPASILGGLLTLQLSADADVRLTLVAIFAGALGSFVHSATSFAVYIGNRQLIRSWSVWYLLRPLIGMALALVFYFLIRAGFMAPSADGGQLNPYGVAGVAGLVGMFSKESSDKLKELFQELFKPPAKEEQLRRDKLRADQPK